MRAAAFPWDGEGMGSMRFLRLPAPLRGIASIVAGSVAGQGLVILAYPLLTRLYSPAEFGLLTVFTSVVSMIAIVATASLEAAVPLPVEDRDAAAVAWGSLGCVAATAAITSLVALVAAAPLTALLGAPQLAAYAWLAGPTVLALGAYTVLSRWMIRDRSYGALGRRNALQGIGQVAPQLGLGLAGAGPIGLLVGLGCGRLVALGGLLSGRGLLRQPWPSMAALRAAVRRYRNFPLLALPSTFLNSAGLEIPLLLISAAYGDVRAGLLGLTVRVVSGPLTIVGQAVYNVFTGESSAAIREPQAAMGRNVRSSVRRLLLAGLLPAAVLMAVGPSLFALVFGPQWSEAGEYARLLAPAYLAQFAIVPVSATLFILERQGQELGWTALRLVLTTAGPVACGLAGAPVSVAIAVLSAGHVVSYVVLYVLCVRAADASDRRFSAEPPVVE
jgi:O-antigen/teichoic acid export membrane protein